ncbi:hypothetical protein [Xanthomonas oryzae]|uniref:hypothetical protein n=1 Tax=Xanthomonas oryzae TaxID=347 RepID=UPI0004630860|nr:hypothetical protein [Xanthomonas oryzae]
MPAHRAQCRPSATQRAAQRATDRFQLRLLGAPGSDHVATDRFEPQARQVDLIDIHRCAHRIHLQHRAARHPQLQFGALAVAAITRVDHLELQPVCAFVHLQPLTLAQTASQRHLIAVPAAHADAAGDVLQLHASTARHRMALLDRSLRRCGHSAERCQQ